SLRGRSIVVLQQTTQTLSTGDAVVGPHLIAGWDNQHVAQPLMIPFFVIMRHEFVNGSPQRGFTNRINRSRHDSLILRTKRSANAFRLGDFGGSRTVSTPAAARVSRNVAVNSGSRSWRRNRLPSKKPSTASVSWRLHCTTQRLSGSEAIPAMCTRRVASS